VNIATPICATMSFLMIDFDLISDEWMMSLMDFIKWQKKLYDGKNVLRAKEKIYRIIPTVIWMKKTT
jgi:hypothetical protein